MKATRIRPRPFVLFAAALVAAAAFAAVGDARTTATVPTNVTNPALSGSAVQGQNLTTTSGTWNGSTPMTYTYGWLRCDSGGNNCNTISGETDQTYTVQAADVGRTIRSNVTATNSAGSASSQSSHTNVVTGASAPQNTSAPTISGTAAVGATLTAANGSWNGATPITYTYQWRRCDSSGAGCSNISSATNNTYQVANADAGHTLRVAVTATNSAGQAQATSAPTGVVQNGAPVNTAAPAISGTPTQGQVLTTSDGTWVGTSPISIAYRWSRCDGNGANCTQLSSNNKSFELTAADVGHKIKVTVTATNSAGSKTADSAPVGPVASSSTLPPGAVKLPNGQISVPAASVTDANRLAIVSVKYSPAAIHGKSPVAVTVKVTEQNKYVVSGALVYVAPVPSNWAAKTAEVQTGQNGTAVVTVTPTAKAPKRGSLVLFVRARTPQGNLLAGSSTRRLIQVRIFAR